MHFKVRFFNTKNRQHWVSAVPIPENKVNATKNVIRKKNTTLTYNSIDL